MVTAAARNGNTMTEYESARPTSFTITNSGSIMISNGTVMSSSTEMNKAFLPLKSYIANPYATNELTRSVPATCAAVRKIEFANHLKYMPESVKSIT